MSVRDMVVEFNEKGFKQLQAKIEKLEKSLQKTKKTANSTSDAFSKMGKVIGGLAIAGTVYKMAKSFKSWVGAIGDMDDKLKSTGLGAELFQTISYKMKEMGLSTEGLTTAMAKFNKVSADNKDTRSADERLMSLADHLKSIKDPAKRSAEAMKYLGKSGAQLIPIFMDGAKGVQELSKMLKDKGSILSQDTIDKAMRVDDAFDKIGQTMDAVKNSFFDAFTQGIETGDQLHNVLKDMANMDWTPLTNAIKEIISLLGKTIININTIFDKIGEKRKNVKKESDEHAKKYFEDVKKRGGKIDFENEWVYFDGDEKRAPYKERLKSPASEQAYILRGFEELNKRLESYTTKSGFSFDEEKSGEKYNINMKVVDELKKIRETSVIEENKEKARNLLKQLGVLKEEKTGETKTGDNKKGTTAVIKTSGGRTSSGIGGGVETISVLMHFKNEFTVFARKLLKLQERGTTYGGQQIQNNRPISLSVNVTANNKSGKELGDEVAKSISKSLKDILNTNTSIIQAIKQHEDTVKEITKDDGKTASIRPSSEPVPNPMA